MTRFYLWVTIRHLTRWLRGIWEVLVLREGKPRAIHHFSTNFSTALWLKRFDRRFRLLYTLCLFRGIFPEQ